MSSQVLLATASVLAMTAVVALIIVGNWWFVAICSVAALLAGIAGWE